LSADPSGSANCDALHISGSGNVFSGAVVSNFGVNESGSNTGDLLIYGNGIDTSKCLTTKPVWAAITARAPVDWPVPMPICSPSCSLATATAGLLVTTVAGLPCKPAPTDKWTVNGPTYVDAGGVTRNVSPGLYCAKKSITINKSGLALSNVGFVAPAVSWSSGTGALTGYTALYPEYGGLLFYAYGSGGLGMSGSNNGLSGAIFVPNGNAQVSGGSSVATCGAGGATTCGFIEALTVQMSGGNGNWHGLGPDFGGTTATTTTTNPDSTTTTPDVVSTVGTGSNLDE
jgi:hypothetical protein